MSHHVICPGADTLPSETQDEATERTQHARWEQNARQSARREHLASMAMQGLLSGDPTGDYDVIAYSSIRAADALIAALDAPKEDPEP